MIAVAGKATELATADPAEEAIPSEQRFGINRAPVIEAGFYCLGCTYVYPFEVHF